MENKEAKKGTSVLLKLLVIICGMMMTLLLTLYWDIKAELIGVGISGVILTILAFKTSMVNMIFDVRNKVNVIIALVFTLIFGIYSGNMFYQVIEALIMYAGLDIGDLNPQMVPMVGAWVVGPIGSIGIYFLTKYILEYLKPIEITKDFLKGLSKTEKIFLIITTVIAVISIPIIYRMTTLFVNPTVRGELIYYDVVYTTDTPAHIGPGTFLRMTAGENDIRQPLFALFILPFSTAALGLSKILFFIPNSFPIILAIIQIIMLNITIILLTRLLDLKKNTQIIFYLNCVSTYPILLFSINMEQYVSAVFWLILFIYSYMKDTRHKDLLYIGMTGSLLTSGIWIVLLAKFKDIKEGIKTIFIVGIKFFMIATVIGQLKRFFHPISSIEYLLQYGGESVSFAERVRQYSDFVEACFIQPKTIVDTITFPHTSYQLAPSVSLNVVGIILIVIACIGFILNYKDRLSQICFVWALYSFVLLVVIGWGAAENGMVLYTLYFGWAFLILIFKTIERLLVKIPYVKIGIQGVLIVTMLYFNLTGIWELIQFGMTYYPMA